MHLQISGSNRSQEDSAFVTPALIRERDAVILDKMHFRRVVGIHQNRIARGAVQRVDLGVNQGVKLFPASRADFEFAWFSREIWQWHNSKMRFAIRCGKFS